MDFYQVVQTRRSHREYKTDVPSEDVITRILNAARLAPTWANMQGMQYIVVNDPELVKDVWRAVNQKQKFIDAPMYIVGIISEKASGVSGNGIKYFTVDFGICFEHLILAATAEGLATCWIGWFNEKKLKQLLLIPEEYRVLGLTPIGYPRTQKGPVEDRKPLSEIVHYNRF
jgi:nitroreductase